jgi:hypothetical protein
MSNKYISKSVNELIEAFKKEGCPICNIKINSILGEGTEVVIVLPAFKL